MKETSLKYRIYSYLKGKPGQWIASAEIERLTFNNTEHTGSNGSRRARELHEEKPERIERKEQTVNGRKLAYYRYVPSAFESFHKAQQEAPASLFDNPQAV